MFRIIAFAILLMPAAASAQHSAPQHINEMRYSVPSTVPMEHAQMGNTPTPVNHAQMRRMPTGPVQTMGRAHGMNGGRTAAADGNSAGAVPTKPGQSAFAAIQEIVEILQADPRTDWSKVDIEALRQHLIDMNNVTLAARVASKPIDGGMRFVVTGNGDVRDSIRRMTSAHAATMDGVGSWNFRAQETDGGAIFEVRVPPQDLVKLKALGFIGVMSLGMHHQEHHLMIARGQHRRH